MMVKDMSLSITPMRWYWPIVEKWPCNENRPWRSSAFRIGPMHFYIQLKERD